MLGDPNGVPWEHAPFARDIFQYACRMDLRAFGVSLSLSVQLAAEEWCFYGRQQQMTWYVLGFAIVSRPLIVVDRMRDTCLHKRAGQSLWCPLGARARDISNTLYRMDLGTFGVSRTSQSSWPHPSAGRRGMVFLGPPATNDLVRFGSRSRVTPADCSRQNARYPPTQACWAILMVSLGSTHA